MTAGGNRFHTRSLKTFYCVPFREKKMETSHVFITLGFFSKEEIKKSLFFVLSIQISDKLGSSHSIELCPQSTTASL